MKKIILLTLFVCSLQAHAACRCSCNPADSRICAALYDIDHPCGNICSSSAPGIAPMITACSLAKVVNPVTGAKVWASICPE